MPNDLRRITRALLSVSDKTGLLDFAKALHERGIELVSTGGTCAALKAAGLPVKDVSDVTGFPEMMDGRVKTLHPKIHGGLLAIRANPVHQASMLAHDIGAIDLLVVNLYPFEATVQAGKGWEDCIENIDIGGPAMIRAAAKNHTAYTELGNRLPPSAGSVSARTSPIASAATPHIQRPPGSMIRQNVAIMSDP